MSLIKVCPCDVDGICPYDAQYNKDCEYWCGEDEPVDDFDDYYDEIGFDPYAGCYTYDC